METFIIIALAALYYSWPVIAALLITAFICGLFIKQW